VGGLVDVDEVLERGRCDVQGLFDVVEAVVDGRGDRGEFV
jgi:hypothetical protein